MRVIYNTCFAEPWVQVAQRLKDEHSFEPVYWNGYNDDDSANIVLKVFPKAIYHSYYDAWKGIFPDEIASRYGQSHIDIDFLKDYASFELQAIKMMDRMDSDRHSFSFMERQRHFRNMLRYWIACINYLKPDLVISAVVPHRVYDYTLYLLCTHLNIKYITFRNSSFMGRIMPLTNVFDIGDYLDQEYKSVFNADRDSKALYNTLHQDIRKNIDRVKQDYAIAEPDYMKQQVVRHSNSDGFFPLLRKFFLDMNEYSDRYMGKNGFLLNGIPTYWKQKNKSIEESRFSLLEYSITKLKTNRYKKRLRKYYNSIAEKPDLNLPYVVLPLHYQPEMTSNPSGDIFTDQHLCVEMIVKHLPSNYSIYVKEHRTQFYAHTEGHTSRIKEFYDDLKKYQNVKFVPTDYDIFELIKNSKAIATVTGTSGWEGMVLGKPVIIFGLSWYEKYSGVLKVTDEKSASMIKEFIEDFRFNEKDLLAYLNAFQQKGVKAYFYRGLKEKMNQSEEECVNNLVYNILEMTDRC